MKFYLPPACSGPAGLHYRPKSEVLQTQLDEHHHITWHLAEAWKQCEAAWREARAKQEIVEEHMNAMNVLLQAKQERKRVERAFRRVWDGRGPY